MAEFFKVVPECEFLLEDDSDKRTRFDACTKNPGHPGFIPVKDFDLNHLPPECRKDEHLECVKLLADRTVKISLPFTSPARPSYVSVSSKQTDCIYFKGKTRRWRCGTGFLWSLFHGLQATDTPCPCRLCKESPNPKHGYYKAEISTARHVIYDDSEACHAKVECFYDSEDNSGVKCLYGISCGSENPDWDQCWFNCVTHDEDLYNRLRGIWNKSERDTQGLRVKIQGMIISHPHGGPKLITMGDTPDVICPYKDEKGSFVIFSGKYRLPSNFQRDVLPPGINKRPGEHVLPSLIAAYHDKVDLKQLNMVDWFTFPPGTTLQQLNRTDTGFPPETEFKGCSMWKTLKYFTYNIPTCPGSSGALVLGGLGSAWRCHSGNDGHSNRSSWSI